MAVQCGGELASLRSDYRALRAAVAGWRHWHASDVARTAASSGIGRAAIRRCAPRRLSGQGRWVTQLAKRPAAAGSPACYASGGGALRSGCGRRSTASGRPAHQCHQQHQNAKAQVDAYPQSNVCQSAAASGPILSRHCPAQPLVQRKTDVHENRHHDNAQR